MLLRESSAKLGPAADLEATVGKGSSDGGVPAGDALVRFGEAVTRGSDDVDPAREALIEAVGHDGFIEASAIVGVFNGLVRTADSSGIPLDDGTLSSSLEFRDKLGLNQFGSAANTDLEAARSGADGSDVESAFR